MQRGFVSNLPISAKIARERSAGSPIDSNSDGLLRLWRDTGFDASSANTADGATAAAQAIDTIKKNERANIAALIVNSKGKRWARYLFRLVEAELLSCFPIKPALRAVRTVQEVEKAGHIRSSKADIRQSRPVIFITETRPYKTQ